MCGQDSRVNLSAEEEKAAAESLYVYCKPVELYNILQRRAVGNPLFLQRCLHYKIQSKHKRRIKMTVSLSDILSDGLQTQSSFPLYILLAKPVSNLAVGEYSAVYRFKRACILANSAGAEGMKRAQADFILPEMNKLAVEVEYGSLVILIISGAEFTDPLGATISNVGGVCLLGTISLELLHLSLEKSPNLHFGERTEVMTTVDMRSHFVKFNYTDEDKFIAVQIPLNSGEVNMPQQVEVIISAEEVGAKEIITYDSYSHNNIPSLLEIIRLRTGNVMFNYKYYNNQLRRTEVTKDFSCPFCLVQCASFKGLRYHLTSSHDLFNFEFWVTADQQVVNVSVKTDLWRSETIADGVHPKQQSFFYCSKPLRRGKPKILVQNAMHVHPLVLTSDIPIAINEDQSKVEAYKIEIECSPLLSQNESIVDLSESLDGEILSSPSAEILSSPSAVIRVISAATYAFADPECVQSVPGSIIVPPKTRKLSAEHSYARNQALLHKRQFFHSHRAQPMAVEQVLSDRDSEDEVDDDVANFEDRRMLDDFVDVTKDERQMMHLWNSFVRKQRVLADGHITWACEAFSKLHDQVLIQTPQLLWCWRIFTIKLWNHGLLDARTMNECNKTFEQCQSQSQCLSQNLDPIISS